VSSFRKFFASLALLALCGILTVFAGFAARSRHLMHDQIVARARAEVDTIQLARRWNSDHGGVWVEKRPGVESNPFLAEPDVATVDGRVLTQQNHAIMTREIADLSQVSCSSLIRLTSLDPLDPANRPDPAEREALLALQRGEKERFWTERRDGRTLFRYMRGLVVEPSCVPCHAEQGFEVGGQRGGISVAFDIGGVERRMASDVVVTAGAGVLVFLALIGPIALLVKRLRGQLKELRRQLEAAATTDPLTGLANRRLFMERLAEELDRHLRLGRSLGFILLDLDHFKEINDTLGHAAGDKVLIHVASVLRAELRGQDVSARIGGDEFVALVRGRFDDESAQRLATRLIAGIERFAPATGASVRLSASVGAVLSQRHPAPRTDHLLAMADAALYGAKRAGRARCVVAGPDSAP
jgi:diguanylate cyclase (GGDEF)-like protein